MNSKILPSLFLLASLSFADNLDNLLEEYKPKKDGSEWYNEGTCDFRITYKNKIFGRDLTDRDIRTLLEGGSIKNKNGDSAILDVDYEYFVRIDYKEKKEDRDF